MDSPPGLRVLLVDGDSKRLDSLEKKLQKCDYTVTTCSVLQEALDKLGARKDVFDIVMCDANMSGEGSFKFVDQVVREMNLPVLLMSDDKDKDERETKIQHHGACGYLHKPIRMNELRNIWQHVVSEQRRRSRSGRFVENQANGNDVASAAAQSEHLNTSSNSNQRKDVDCNKDAKERKKSRVVWTEELHQKFLNAMSRIGNDKIGPKRILELMNVQGLTRDHVASHLQKYRQHLLREERKQNDQNAASAAAPPAEMMPMQMHYGYLSPVQYVNSGYQIMINEKSALWQPTMVADNSYGVRSCAYQGNVGMIQQQQRQVENICSTITSNGSMMCPSIQSYLSLFSEAPPPPPNQFHSQLQDNHLPLRSEALQIQYGAEFQAQDQLNHLQFPSEARPTPYRSHVQVQHPRDFLPLPSLQAAPRISDCADINPASNGNALVCHQQPQSLPASKQNLSQLTRNDHISDQIGVFSTVPDKQQFNGGSSAEYGDSVADLDDLTGLFSEETQDDIHEFLSLNPDQIRSQYGDLGQFDS